MSRRFMPERSIASRTTGLTNSTSLRSRSFTAVSCAKPITPTSLKISAPPPSRSLLRGRSAACRVVPRSQRRSQSQWGSPCSSRVGLVLVVVGVGLAGGLEPLDVAGVGLQLLGPDRVHPHAHPHL